MTTRNMVEELMAIEDKKFLDHVEYAIEFQRLSDERRVWRGEDGLVHILVPQVYDNTNNKPYIASWWYICHGKVLSGHLREREPEAIPTCLSCIGGRDARHQE